MTEHIVNVEPSVNQFSVTWMLGSFCNYACMYCPPEFNDTTSKPHSLKTMQEAWRNIYAQAPDLPIKISFTGGEVTANKNFLCLIKWLNTEYPAITDIIVTTNGSASKRYYLDLAQHVTALSFSTHAEYIKEQQFFDTVLAVHNAGTGVHVNIMNEHWHTDRILLYTNFLSNHNINYTINEIEYSHKTREKILSTGEYNLVT